MRGFFLTNDLPRYVIDSSIGSLLLLVLAKHLKNVSLTKPGSLTGDRAVGCKISALRNNLLYSTSLFVTCEAEKRGEIALYHYI